MDISHHDAPLALKPSYTLETFVTPAQSTSRGVKDIRILVPRSGVTARMAESPALTARILSGAKHIWDMTLCSTTVQNTVREIFGVVLPRGNPIDILPSYYRASQVWNKKRKTLPFSQEEFKKRIASHTLVDVIAESPTRPRIKHRFFVFSEIGGERFAVDPYLPIDGQKSLSPIPLEQYLRAIYDMGYVPIGLQGYTTDRAVL